MPFTPSHAVVALPFLRSPLVPAAIAVGAMAPDLPLFVPRLPLHYAHTHELAWLPVTAVLAIGMLLAWRSLLRPAVVDLVPAWVAARLPDDWRRRAVPTLHETFVGTRGALVTSGLLLASSALGVLTHILWDAFTHEGRFGVRLIPALDQEWGGLLGYKWLQYGSGVVGVVIMAVWAVRWLARRKPIPVRQRVPGVVRVLWWCSLPVVLVVAAAVRVNTDGLDAVSGTSLIYATLVPAASLWGFGTVTLCLAIVLLSRRRS